MMSVCITPRENIPSRHFEIKNSGHLVSILRTMGIEFQSGEITELVRWLEKASPLDKKYFTNFSIKILGK